jgi:hypothetical protein
MAPPDLAAQNTFMPTTKPTKKPDTLGTPCIRTAAAAADMQIAKCMEASG